MKTIKNEPLSSCENKLSKIEDTTVKTHGMAMELLPCFKWIRWLGRCPLLFEISERNGLLEVHSEFKCCWNQSFLMSAFVALFVSTCCILNAIHDFSRTNVFGDFWPVAVADETDEFFSKIKPMPRYMINSFGLIICMVVVLEYIVLWLTSPTLSQWLNNWNEIDKDFKAQLGRFYKPDLSKTTKRFALPYIIIPTVLYGISIYFFDVNLKYPFGVVVVLTACCFSTACLQSEDTKVVLMFKAIEMSFNQVYQMVSVRYEQRVALRNKKMRIIRPSDIDIIRNWSMVLVKIRKIGDTTGKYLCYHQLISIGSQVYFSAANVFIVANLLGDISTLYTGFPMVASFSIITNARLFIKIFAAVRITDEEKRLANLLKNLEFLEDDFECRQEVKDIYELLVHHPTEISLNNFVSLNNSLILSIFGQILANFVVFMQFQSSME